MNDTEPFEQWLRVQAENSVERAKGASNPPYWHGRAEAFDIAADALMHFRETGELLS